MIHYEAQKNRIKYFNNSILFVIGLILYPVLYYDNLIRPRIYYRIDYNINLTNEEKIIEKVENFNYSTFLNYDIPLDPFFGIKGFVDADLIQFLKSRVENDTGLRRKLRNNLRQILVLAIYDEIEILDNYDSLYEVLLDFSPEEQKEVAYLQGTKHELFELLDNSICVCPICTQEDRDMVFIPDHKTWYCAECQQKGLIWDPSQGSEEDRDQNDYVKWYLKQKERFAKKYLNNAKGNIDN